MIVVGHVQGQCGDVEERDGQVRRTVENIERSVAERWNVSVVKDSDNDDRTGSSSRRSSARCHVRKREGPATTAPLQTSRTWIEQDMMIDTEAPEVSDDKEESGGVDRPEQGPPRTDDDEDMPADEQKQRRATNKQPERRSSSDDETDMTSSKRTKAGGDNRDDQGRDP